MLPFYLIQKWPFHKRLEVNEIIGLGAIAILYRKGAHGAFPLAKMVLISEKHDNLVLLLL